MTTDELLLKIKELEWRVRALEEPKELNGEQIMAKVYERIKTDWGFISDHLITIIDARRAKRKKKKTALIFGKERIFFASSDKGGVVY